MNSGIYDEGSFEDAIAAHLVEKGGYERLSSDEFDRERGIFPETVISFVKQTQPEKWEKLETAYPGNAEKRFLQELTSALERQGALEILRHGFRTTGTTIDLAAFKPNTGLNPEVQRRYEANRLGVTQQFYYSTTEPKKSIDLALSLNGIPVATAELKNPSTNQNVEDAKRQYEQDRDPGEPVLRFKRGALVSLRAGQARGLLHDGTRGR